MPTEVCSPISRPGSKAESPKHPISPGARSNPSRGDDAARWSKAELKEPKGEMAKKD